MASPMFRTSLHACGLVAFCILLPACAGLGHRLERAAAPEGAPDIKKVLRDLAANDAACGDAGAAIRNFRAAGTFTLECPEVEGIQRFTSGMIAFRTPADLCVVGRVRLGAIAFRLTCVGREFLVEFPTERDPEKRYYYQLQGEKFESVPFSVSPSDVAREMFLPESWSALKPKEVRITAYDARVQAACGDAEAATIEIGPTGHPRRRLVVVPLAHDSGTPQWVVARSELLDDAGRTIALTTKGDYREVDGFRFPSRIEVQFPGENARMTFEMRNIKINTNLVNDSTFAFNWRPSHETQTHRPDPVRDRPGAQP